MGLMDDGKRYELFLIIHFASNSIAISSYDRRHSKFLVRLFMHGCFFIITKTMGFRMVAFLLHVDIISISLSISLSCELIKLMAFSHSHTLTHSHLFALISHHTQDHVITFSQAARRGISCNVSAMTS